MGEGLGLDGEHAPVSWGCPVGGGLHDVGIEPAGFLRPAQEREAVREVEGG